MPPLIGRDDELLRLRAVCGMPGGAFARIIGRPGIGKTVLLDAVLGLEVRALRGSAEPGDRDRPFATLMRLFEQAEWQVDHSPTGELHEAPLARHLSALLQAHGDRLIAVDDAQWCDEASRSLLRATSALGTRAPVVFAERDYADADASEDAPRIALGPLGSVESHRLVRALSPTVTPIALSEIVQAAAGIPFGLVVLAEAHAGSPEAPFATLARRLSREPAMVAKMTRLVCCYDDVVPLLALAYAANINEGAVAVALSAVSDLIVVEDGLARARHPLIADLVRADDPAPAATARFAYDAERHVDDRSLSGLQRLRRTAQSCGERGVYVTTSVEIATQLARERRHGEAAPMFAAAYSAQPQLDGATLRSYLDALRALGRESEAVEIGQTAFHDALTRGDGLSAARIASAIVHGMATLDREADVDAFLSEAARATAILRDAGATAYVRSIMLSNAAFGGNLARFDDLAVAAPLSARDERAAAFVFAIRGNTEESDAAMAHWRASAPPWAIWDDHLEACRRLFLGGPGGLRQSGEFAWHVAADRSTNAPVQTALSAFYDIATANWDDADQVLASTDPFDAEGDGRWMLLETGLMLDALRSRPPRNARRVLHELRTAIGLGKRRSIWAAAAWWVAANARAAGSPAEDLATYVARTTTPWPRAWHLAALPLAAVFGRIHLPASAVETIVEEFPRPGNPWADAHALLARGLLDGDDEVLLTARDAFERLAAPGFTLIAGMGLAQPVPRDAALAGALGYGAGTKQATLKLTARELAVARLVASGFSNKEIAAQLGIVDRTVETHLTNIYTKLQVTNRAQLTARLVI